MFKLKNLLPVIGGAVGFMLGGFGGAIKGAALGSALSGSSKKRRPAKITTHRQHEGSKLNDLKVQISSYGEVIPKIYGTVRLAGNIIWATDIKEAKNTSNEYRENDQQVEVNEITNYSYCVSLAISICEGEIEEIIRIWADGKLMTDELLRRDNGKFNIYLGSEDQLPDNIIGKYKPANTYPAYRGLCYVVFDDLPLEQFDNHIPSFTFEVRKKAQIKPSVEDKIKEVVLIPGAGEFVYGSQIHYKKYQVKLRNKTIGHHSKNYLNMHNYSGKANMCVAIDQMAKTLPNLEWVAVVVSWFATSSDAGNCRIVPKVEFNIAKPI